MVAVDVWSRDDDSQSGTLTGDGSCADGYGVLDGGWLDLCLGFGVQRRRRLGFGLAWF